MRPAQHRDTQQKPPVGGAVLVVDDEGMMRTLVSRILRDAGYDVLLAASAADARRVEMTLDRLDLVLTDIAMPGGLGPELVADLRKHRPTLKVLFMSQYDPEDLRRHGIDLQDLPCLRKPFMPEQLLTAVQTVLRP